MHKTNSLNNFNRAEGTGSRSKAQGVEGQRKSVRVDQPVDPKGMAHRSLPKAHRDSIARCFFRRCSPGTINILSRRNRFDRHAIVEGCLRDYYFDTVSAARESGMEEGRRQERADMIAEGWRIQRRAS